MKGIAARKPAYINRSTCQRRLGKRRSTTKATATTSAAKPAIVSAVGNSYRAECFARAIRVKTRTTKQQCCLAGRCLNKTGGFRDRVVAVATVHCSQTRDRRRETPQAWSSRRRELT